MRGLLLALMLLACKPKPSDACLGYCSCMEQRCRSTPRYRYPDRDRCLATCAAFTTEQLSCWSIWCEDVITQPKVVAHLCEHAWGQYALDECELQ